MTVPTTTQSARRETFLQPGGNAPFTRLFSSEHSLCAVLNNVFRPKKAVGLPSPEVRFLGFHGHWSGDPVGLAERPGSNAAREELHFGFDSRARVQARCMDNVGIACLCHARPVTHRSTLCVQIGLGWPVPPFRTGRVTPSSRSDIRRLTGKRTLIRPTGPGRTGLIYSMRRLSFARPPALPDVSLWETSPMATKAPSEITPQRIPPRSGADRWAGNHRRV